MIKTILFDFDGVIVDNTKGLIGYHQKTAKSMGLRIPSDDEMFSYFGKPWDKVIGELWPDVDSDRFKAEFLTMIQEDGFDQPVTKGFNEALSVAKEFGFKTGVVTGNNKRFVMDLMKRQGIDMGKFDVIVTSEDTTKHKPEPDPVLLACSTLKVKPEDSVYIGDSLVDYQSAKSANTHFIGFRWKGINKEFYERNGVFNSVTSMRELEEKIKKMQGMQIRRVVTCFLEKEGKILLLKRGEPSKSFIGKWSAVQGNIHGDESPVEAAKREVMEETGTTPNLIKDGGVFDVEDEKLGVIWKVHPFLFKAKAGKVTLNEENDDYRWVAPDDMEMFDTVPMLKESFMILSNGK